MTEGFDEESGDYPIVMTGQHYKKFRQNFSDGIHVRFLKALNLNLILNLNLNLKFIRLLAIHLELSYQNPINFRKSSVKISRSFQLLVNKCKASIIHDGQMMDKLVQLLIALTDSQARAFRHTATFAGMLFPLCIDFVLQK